MTRLWIIIALALGLAIALALSCGGDDDDSGGDDNADDTGDDTSADDDTVVDDDTTPSRQERCQSFVDGFYTTCEHGLFGLSQTDAVTGCVENSNEQAPWDCSMECWEAAPGDCPQWGQCIIACGIVIDDDTAGDDTVTD